MSESSDEGKKHVRKVHKHERKNQEYRLKYEKRRGDRYKDSNDRDVNKRKKRDDSVEHSHRHKKYVNYATLTPSHEHWRQTEKLKSDHNKHSSRASCSRAKHDTEWEESSHTFRDSKGHETEHKSREQRKADGYLAKSSDDHKQSHKSRGQEQSPERGRDSDRRRSRESFEQDTRSDSESSTDESRSGDKPVFDINWENYKYTLSKIFFRDQDLVKRGSQESDDFWVFLKKYLAFQRKKAAEFKTLKKDKVGNRQKDKFDIPQVYDRRHRINMTLAPRDVVNCIREDRYRPGVEPLTEKMVEQFTDIYLHYLDFLQKQKFAKMVKIRHDQENLPIFKYKDAIIEAVKQHSVVVVAGDTGCGKSTQVPQYLLQGGFEQVACTQPRRIACISLAKRVAYETLNEYGSQVAYQVRFEKTKTKITRILFLTEGLLLRQITTDPLLNCYSVIVIDEVHERHIHTDFLLGVVKCLLQQRADLKLVLMSATININLFSNYFDEAPVITVPGRLYPIELEYLPISAEDRGSKSQRLDPAPYIRVLQRIDHKFPLNERGDVLVFLSGMTEIMTVLEAAQAYAEHSKQWIILPLHSALSVAEQDKVFDFPPEGVRKCIISTNIAETSVTIDGVRFVVDSGKVKEMSFDTKCKMQRLQEFWISRASAEQRKGRSGRTGPGVCYRLYDESDYNDLQPYSTPEIHRVPLDSLVLQMISMGLNDARRFPFIEPPLPGTIETSIIFLKEQNAMTSEEAITPVGKMLSQLPVDVVIGKMLIMGSIFHMIDPVLSTAAALSVQSPFTAKAHSDNDAMSARKPLESDHGDPFTLLNAFDEWVQVKAEDRSNSRKWCRRRGLEEQRFYEMTRLKTQFHQILKDHGLLETPVEEPKASTSYERKIQHAEKRKLREMKRDHQRSRNKRKILKLEDDFAISGDEGGEDDLDSNIRDLEFRLMNDLDSMQDKSNQSRNFTGRQITMLKIILCSGLYPQVALADESNSSQSEGVFHTRNKPFVVLHPTSIFSMKSELLELSDFDIKEAPPGAKANNRRQPLSNKHQLLPYVSLLETTKPYLMGVMRVPALQTLALYASSIDTNSDCSRLLFDGWLEVAFPKPEEGATNPGEETLSSSVQLRTTWHTLVQAKLDVHKMEDDGELRQKVHKLERTLVAKLTEFLSSDTVYSIRKIMSAELAHIYYGPASVGTDATGRVLAELCRGAEQHPVKGGLKVNDYLTYNCLQDETEDYASYMQKHWICPTCTEHFVVTVVERLRHEQECTMQGKQEPGEPDTTEIEGQGKNDGKDPLRRGYSCEKCGKHLLLTPTEILRHRRQCNMAS